MYEGDEGHTYIKYIIINKDDIGNGIKAFGNNIEVLLIGNIIHM